MISNEEYENAKKIVNEFEAPKLMKAIMEIANAGAWFRTQDYDDLIFKISAISKSVIWVSQTRYHLFKDVEYSLDLGETWNSLESIKKQSPQSPNKEST